MTPILRGVAALCVLVLISMASPARAGTVLDPVGDTFGNSPVPLDITSVTTAVAGGSVQFTIDFAGASSPPSVDPINGVVGFIDLDTDQNESTGREAFTNLVGPQPDVALADEFVVVLFTETFHPGLVEVLDSSNVAVGSVPISFAASSLSLSIPLTLLGGDDGLLNYAVIVGHLPSPTDRIPNGETPLSTAAVPEPAALLLLGSGIAGLSAVAWRRHR